MGAQISRGFGNLRAKIIISLFFLDEAWKPVGAACVCRVTFSMSPDLFTSHVCVYSTKHHSVSVDSVVCKACLCGCPEAVRTSSFDLSFRGHDRTFGVKGRILYLATLPLKGPEIQVIASAVCGEGR